MCHQMSSSFLAACPRGWLVVSFGWTRLPTSSTSLEPLAVTRWKRNRRRPALKGSSPWRPAVPELQPAAGFCLIETSEDPDSRIQPFKMLVLPTCSLQGTAKILVSQPNRELVFFLMICKLCCCNSRLVIAGRSK